MTARVITCANCGAKYKLPASFKAAQARCKSCGAVIDVEASATPADAAPPAASKPAETPAPPKPAAKASGDRPSARRSGGASRRSGGGSKVSGARSRRGRQAATDDEEEAPAGRAGRRGGAAARRGAGARGGRGRGRAAREEAPEGNKMGLYLGIGGGVVAIVAVVLVIVLGGKDPEKPQQPNQEQQTAQKPEQQKPAEQQKPEQKPDDKTAKTDEPTETPGKTDETGEPKKDDTTKEATAKKDPPKATAFDAKTLPELAWPADTSSSLKKEITDLVEKTVTDEGIAGLRAGRKLGSEEMGRHAYPAIVNRLRIMNYFDGEQSMKAYELNKILEAITLGRNAGYKAPVDPYAPVEEADAYWNAKTVRAWHRQWDGQFAGGDPEVWNEFIEKRKAKKDDIGF